MEVLLFYFNSYLRAQAMKLLRDIMSCKGNSTADGSGERPEADPSGQEVAAT